MRFLICFFVLCVGLVGAGDDEAGYQVIYLNGASSAGKSTLAKGLQWALPQSFLHIGIDSMVEMMPPKLNDWTGGPAPKGFSWKKVDGTWELQLGPEAEKIANSFREVVATLVDQGHRVIVDDVSLGRAEVDQWRRRLMAYKVLWIGVTAPIDVIEQREKERSNRLQGTARAQAERVHEGVKYNIMIDTHAQSLKENVDTIYNRFFADCGCK